MGEETQDQAPDRAEEKRVDVPQNQTAAPVEQAQADAPDAQPTEQATSQVTETRTETHTEPAPSDSEGTSETS